MRIAKIEINNFRGIKKCELLLSGHTVLVGDNNTCKSTVLEAIDLVLGPDRLSKRPVIDEHDFYAGDYIGLDGNSIEIKIEVVIVDLSDEQKRHFVNHIEWWNQNEKILIDSPPAEITDETHVISALRVGFTGVYDKDEDDFSCSTYFLSPKNENGQLDPFRTSDKRLCGFLFLRTIRTGSRALSLERGSLLDIILRLQDKRLQMWEDVLKQLRIIQVADKPEIGINEILSTVQDSIRSLVPSDWGENPHIKVSDLTRENLRKTLTVFMSTGSKNENGDDYAAPFYHQGTGTINTLVLALLSLIAELKQNVIFAMEEPEIAIPPYTQKRIINSVRSKSAQAIFTSHSPYVLEEFNPQQILLLQREKGILKGISCEYPPTVKAKSYNKEMRTRFCESLLARRVFITEGRTEYDAFPCAAKRLHDLLPSEFSTLESLGIAIINAETDSQIAPLGEYFFKIGKIVFATFDKQQPEQKMKIEAVIKHHYESPEHDFETLLVKETTESGLRRYADYLIDNRKWPTHLAATTPNNTMRLADLQASLCGFLDHYKGEGVAADLLGMCEHKEMPKFIVDTLLSIQAIVNPKEPETSV